ncbi:MAG TPA: hypothetical protein DCG48_00460 [Rhodospirillaceae bacterium]|nr:hypothetical protein [Rhodospirillaceae bacterium]
MRCPARTSRNRNIRLGKVPAIRDADLHLYETLAICVYIDEEYTSDPQLQPRDCRGKGGYVPAYQPVHGRRLFQHRSRACHSTAVQSADGQSLWMRTGSSVPCRGSNAT